MVKLLTLFTGCGSDVQDKIGRIIDRTIAWIEHDGQRQGAKTPPPVAAPSVRLKKEQSAPGVSVDQMPSQSSDTNHLAMAIPSSAMPSQQPQQQPPLSHQQAGSQPERTYYADSNLNGHAAYTGLAYGDDTQGSHMAAQSYNTDSMFYPNPHQAAAAAAAAAAPSGETHSNPLVSFAAQDTHHVVDPTSPLYWQRTGGNTWQDWTAAVAHNQDTQDRYGAGALLSLGSTGDMGMSVSVPRLPIPSLAEGASGPQDMTNQWPLIVFEQQQQQQSQHPHAPNQQHPHHPHGAGDA